MALSSVLLETVRTHAGGGALDIGLPDLLAILRQMRRIAEGVQKPVFKQHLDLDMKRIGPLFNSSGLRRGETPSGNGNCSARGLALVAAAMASRRHFHDVVNAEYFPLHSNLIVCQSWDSVGSC